MRPKELRQYAKKELDEMLLKGFANVSPLLIIVLTIIIISGIYFAFVKKSEPPIFQPTATPNILSSQAISPATATSVSAATSTLASDEAIEWKTYRNEKYGFEIDYPVGGAAGWTFDGEAEIRHLAEEMLFVVRNKRGFVFNGAIDFFLPECSDYNWKEIIKNREKFTITFYECSYLAEISIAVKEIKSDFGIEGYKIDDGIRHGALIRGAIFPFKLIKIKNDFPPKIISKNGIVYPVLNIIYPNFLIMEDWNEDPNYPIPTSDEMKIFDKVISSLRYIGN